MHTLVGDYWKIPVLNVGVTLVTEKTWACFSGPVASILVINPDLHHAGIQNALDLVKPQGILQVPARNPWRGSKSEASTLHLLVKWTSTIKKAKQPKQNKTQEQQQQKPSLVSFRTRLALTQAVIWDLLEQLDTGKFLITEIISRQREKWGKNLDKDVKEYLEKTQK